MPRHHGHGIVVLRQERGIDGREMPHAYVRGEGGMCVYVVCEHQKGVHVEGVFISVCVAVSI